MKKEQSKLGLTSFILSLIPLLGFGVMFVAMSADPENNVIQKLATGFMWATIIIPPVVGLILGIISLLQKTKRLIFPIIGTLLNSSWVVFLIWAYIQLDIIAHSI